MDVLPDGRDTVVIGDPDGDKAFTHRQGDNWLGFEGTCGVCSCENVLRSFGLDVAETHMVIIAVQRGLCVCDNLDPGHNGGTTLGSQAEILTRHGVPASAFYGDKLLTPQAVSKLRGQAIRRMSCFAKRECHH